jgi:hypothetical protein
MKYCKSKRGYFYKVVGDKKTRISMEEYKAGCKKRAMKGGFTEDGRVERNDFYSVEKLNNANRNDASYFPILILFNGNRIPHIFFDYNKDAGRYNYVIYYETHGINLLVIKKIDNHGNISEVGLLDIDNGLFNIGDRMILLLCNEFFKKYEELTGTDQMTNMYNLLKQYFVKFMTIYPEKFKNSTGSSTTPYRIMAEEILSKFKSKQ